MSRNRFVVLVAAVSAALLRWPPLPRLRSAPRSRGSTR